MPTANENDGCGTCRFFKKAKDSVDGAGMCLRYPPQFVVIPFSETKKRQMKIMDPEGNIPEVALEGRFPQVDAEKCWCGEWQSMETPETE